MTQKRILLCLAHMSGHEMKFIQEAFDTNWVVPLGPNVNGFEKDLEQYMGQNKRVVALSADSMWRWPRRRGHCADIYLLCIFPSYNIFGCNSSVCRL